MSEDQPPEMMIRFPTPRANSGVAFRNHALDGMRGYAAVAVIFFHAILGFNMDLVGSALTAPFQTIQTWSNYLAKIVLMIFNGHSAVDLFFVLSGCVLIAAFERLLARAPMPNAVLIFMIRRTLRIMPNLIVCVVVIAFVIGMLSLIFPKIVASYRWEEIRDNLFVQRASVNGASWTLRIEMLAIIPMIIAGFIYKAFNAEGLIVFLLFSLVATENPWLVYNFSDLAGNLFYFALGALIPTRIGIQTAQLKYGLIVPLIAFLFVRSFFPYEAFTPRLVQGFACYLIVVKVFYGGFPKFNRILTLPVSRHLGKLSYSIYLWNVLILNVIYAFRPVLPSWLHDHALLAGLITGVPIFLLTIAIAHFSEIYIERPFIRLGSFISLDAPIGKYLPVRWGNCLPSGASDFRRRKDPREGAGVAAADVSEPVNDPAP